MSKKKSLNLNTKFHIAENNLSVFSDWKVVWGKVHLVQPLTLILRTHDRNFSLSLVVLVKPCFGFKSRYD